MRLLWLLLLVACQRSAPEVEALRLLGFQQEAARGVLLNENLVFYFSDELDPASVTPSSARVLDAAGRLVDGELRVEGNRLVFEPELARSMSLADGGFHPGAIYRVELTGFPVISGLRSRTGLVLERGFASEFRTVVASAESALWLDPVPQVSALVYLEATTVGVSAPIQLTAPEPLDPRSIAGSLFELRFEAAEGELVTVALRAQLVENSMERGAVIELRAVDDGPSALPRPLEVGRYHLWVHDGLRDLGGAPVTSSWAVTQVPAQLQVELLPGEAGNRSRRLDFLDPLMASPEEVPGVDGALRWRGTGAVTTGFFRAAGTGQDGGQELTGRLAERDLQATRLVVPAGGVLELAVGAVGASLRSQTNLRVDGTLLRRATDEAKRRREGEDWASWYGRARTRVELLELRNSEGRSLSEWLAAERGREWTALVAAGDLVITGDVRVDGPLLLAAGGRIRVDGEIEAGEIWLVGAGGGSRLWPPARLATLGVEAPEGNPLRTTVRGAQLSAPLRPTGKPIRWRSAVVGAHAGAGRVAVRYLGERDLPGGRVERIGPVDDAALLDRCEALRLLIELEMDPGPRWDPPMVDFVEVRWTEESDR